MKNNEYLVKSNEKTGKTTSASQNAQLVFSATTPTREKDWYIFTSAFFNLSKIGCENVLNSKFTKNNKYLSLSIIFNLKHGLEVMLKAFNRNTNPEIDTTDKHHDIKMIFRDFKNSKSFKNKVNKLKTTSLNKELSKLEKFVERYYGLDFINEYLKDSFKIKDKENTFFKYPENSAVIMVDYSTFLDHFTKTDIKNIKSDIEEIEKIIKKIKNFIS